jgi:hypothetical protein
LIQPKAEVHARYDAVFAAFERLDAMLRGVGRGA